MSDSLELAIEQAAYHVSNDLELGTTDKVLTAIYPVVHDYIAAATPHIRAALFDELIADITERAGTANIHMYSDVDETGQFITESLYFDDWIAELKNKENTQP